MGWWARRKARKAQDHAGIDILTPEPAPQPVGWDRSMEPLLYADDPRLPGNSTDIGLEGDSRLLDRNKVAEVVELETILDEFDTYGYTYAFGYNLNREPGDQVMFKIFDEGTDHVWFGPSKLVVIRSAWEEVQRWPVSRHHV